MNQVKVRLSKFCWLCPLLDVSYSVISYKIPFFKHSDLTFDS